MYFSTKSYLKSTHNHTTKHAPKHALKAKPIVKTKKKPLPSPKWKN
jgi:hypothetical protein